MHFDPRGCPVSTGSASAIAHAETALWRMLTYFGNPLDDLDAAIAADPGWALPYVLKANCLLSGAEHAYALQAQALLDMAAEVAARGRTPQRERDHIVASRACAAGQWRQACDLWERILVEHPRDVAALLAAHLFDFYRGDARNLDRRVARVLPAWSAELPLYSHVLGLRAFGLEECHHYDQAMDTALQALSIDPRDPWAVHAVAHVHEMRGEHAQGAQWLSSRSADWAPDNGFAFHNWWHLGLFHLERMEVDAALALFDERIAVDPQMALQNVDITAMLWRLQLLGVDVGERWQAAAALWPQQQPDAGFYPFNDFHAAMAFVGAGQTAQARELLQAVQARAADGDDPARMAANVGVPLIGALLDYAEGRHDAATDGLLRVRERASAFGGSHAQRDVIELTLLDAAARSGQHRLARHLLNERLQAKAGTPLTAHWQARVS
jgi:tetratricopeptide (TPR) repeat protein